MDLVTKPVETTGVKSSCPFCGGSGSISVTKDGIAKSVDCSCVSSKSKDATMQKSVG